jgi:hypothetical protein
MSYLPIPTRRRYVLLVLFGLLAGQLLGYLIFGEEIHWYFRKQNNRRELERVLAIADEATRRAEMEKLLQRRRDWLKITPAPTIPWGPPQPSLPGGVAKVVASGLLLAVPWLYYCRRCRGAVADASVARPNHELGSHFPDAEQGMS